MVLPLSFVFMKWLRLTLFASCIICCSCNRENDIARNFKDIISEIAVSENNACVFIGNHEIVRLTETFSLRQASRKYKDIDFYFCNVTNRANIYLQYILHTEVLPQVLIFNNDAELLLNAPITSREDLDVLLDLLVKDRLPELTSNFYSQTGSELSALLRTQYRAYCALHESGCEKILYTIDSLCLDNDYYYLSYLGYKLSKKCDEYQKSNQYLLSIKDKMDEDNIYSYLDLELRKELAEGEYPVLVSDFSIDIGELRSGQIKEVTIPLHNMGASALVILETIPSCNCIENITYKNIIMPNESSELTFTIKASDNGDMGDFVRTIAIISNTQYSDETFFITGKYK